MRLKRPYTELAFSPEGVERMIGKEFYLWSSDSAVDTLERRGTIQLIKEVGGGDEFDLMFNNKKISVAILGVEYKDGYKSGQFNPEGTYTTYNDTHMFDLKLKPF